MEAVVFVMMALVCFNYVLKQTYRKMYSVVFSAVVCALFVGCMWPYAIDQSKSQISVWLSDSALMLDMSVVLTWEVAIQMAFCILSARIQTSGKVKPLTIWIYRFLRWFPGVLIFPVLFSLLVSSIFAMPGASFPAVAWTLAAMVLAGILSGTYVFRRLLPEKDIRLELLFLSNALIAVLGVIATVNGRTAVAGTTRVDWLALGGIGVLLAVGLAAGLATYRIRLNRIIKNR